MKTLNYFHQLNIDCIRDPELEFSGQFVNRHFGSLCGGERQNDKSQCIVALFVMVPVFSFLSKKLNQVVKELPIVPPQSNLYPVHRSVKCDNSNKRHVTVPSGNFICFVSHHILIRHPVQQNACV